MAIPSFSLIVTAAGSSSRFKDDLANGSVKKEFISLAGHSVLYHSIVPFLAIPSLKAVVVTYAPEVEVQTKYALEDLCLQHHFPVMMVEGGDTRQKSVLNALLALQKNDLGAEFVMIHDGARPFVSTDNIISIFAAATYVGAAAGAIRIADALVSTDENNILKSHVDKSSLRLIQTPQIFGFGNILMAHQKAAESGEVFLDDTSIYRRYVGEVALCDGDERNRKITWPHDLETPFGEVR